MSIAAPVAGLSFITQINTPLKPFCSFVLMEQKRSAGEVFLSGRCEDLSGNFAFVEGTRNAESDGRRWPDRKCLGCWHWLLLRSLSLPPLPLSPRGGEAERSPRR